MSSPRYLPPPPPPPPLSRNRVFHSDSINIPATARRGALPIRSPIQSVSTRKRGNYPRNRVIISSKTDSPEKTNFTGLRGEEKGKGGGEGLSSKREEKKRKEKKRKKKSVHGFSFVSPGGTSPPLTPPPSVPSKYLRRCVGTGTPSLAPLGVDASTGICYSNVALYIFVCWGEGGERAWASNPKCETRCNARFLLLLEFHSPVGCSGSRTGSRNDTAFSTFSFIQIPSSLPKETFEPRKKIFPIRP